MLGAVFAASTPYLASYLGTCSRCNSREDGLSLPMTPEAAKARPEALGAPHRVSDFQALTNAKPGEVTPCLRVQTCKSSLLLRGKYE